MDRSTLFRVQIDADTNSQFSQTASSIYSSLGSLSTILDKLKSTTPNQDCMHKIRNINEHLSKLDRVIKSLDITSESKTIGSIKQNIQKIASNSLLELKDKFADILKVQEKNQTSTDKMNELLGLSSALPEFKSSKVNKPSIQDNSAVLDKWEEKFKNTQNSSPSFESWNALDSENLWSSTDPNVGRLRQRQVGGISETKKSELEAATSIRMNINQIHSMMQSVARMTLAQGETVSSIDDNIEEAGVYFDFFTYGMPEENRAILEISLSSEDSFTSLAYQFAETARKLNATSGWHKSLTSIVTSSRQPRYEVFTYINSCLCVIYIHDPEVLPNDRANALTLRRWVNYLQIRSTALQEKLSIAIAKAHASECIPIPILLSVIYDPSCSLFSWDPSNSQVQKPAKCSAQVINKKSNKNLTNSRRQKTSYTYDYETYKEQNSEKKKISNKNLNRRSSPYENIEKMYRMSFQMASAKDTYRVYHGPKIISASLLKNIFAGDIEIPIYKKFNRSTKKVTLDYINDINKTKILEETDLISSIKISDIKPISLSAFETSNCAYDSEFILKEFNSFQNKLNINSILDKNSENIDYENLDKHNVDDITSITAKGIEVHTQNNQLNTKSHNSYLSLTTYDKNLNESRSKKLKEFISNIYLDNDEQNHYTQKWEPRCTYNREKLSNIEYDTLTKLNSICNSKILLNTDNITDKIKSNLHRKGSLISLKKLSKQITKQQCPSLSIIQSAYNLSNSTSLATLVQKQNYLTRVCSIYSQLSTIPNLMKKSLKHNIPELRTDISSVKEYNLLTDKDIRKNSFKKMSTTSVDLNYINKSLPPMYDKHNFTNSHQFEGSSKVIHKLEPLKVLCQGWNCDIVSNFLTEFKNQPRKKITLSEKELHNLAIKGFPGVVENPPSKILPFLYHSLGESRYSLGAELKKSLTAFQEAALRLENVATPQAIYEANIDLRMLIADTCSALQENLELTSIPSSLCSDQKTFGYFSNNITFQTLKLSAERYIYFQAGQILWSNFCKAYEKENNKFKHVAAYMKKNSLYHLVSWKFKQCVVCHNKSYYSKPGIYFRKSAVVMAPLKKLSINSFKKVLYPGLLSPSRAQIALVPYTAMSCHKVNNIQRSQSQVVFDNYLQDEQNTISKNISNKRPVNDIDIENCDEKNFLINDNNDNITNFMKNKKSNNSNSSDLINSARLSRMKYSNSKNKTRITCCLKREKQEKETKLKSFNSTKTKMKHFVYRNPSPVEINDNYSNLMINCNTLATSTEVYQRDVDYIYNTKYSNSSRLDNSKRFSHSNIQKRISKVDRNSSSNRKHSVTKIIYESNNKLNIEKNTETNSKQKPDDLLLYSFERNNRSSSYFANIDSLFKYDNNEETITEKFNRNPETNNKLRSKTSDFHSSNKYNEKNVDIDSNKFLNMDDIFSETFMNNESNKEEIKNQLKKIQLNSTRKTQDRLSINNHKEYNSEINNIPKLINYDDIAAEYNSGSFESRRDLMVSGNITKHKFVAIGSDNVINYSLPINYLSKISHTNFNGSKPMNYCESTENDKNCNILAKNQDFTVPLPLEMLQKELSCSILDNSPTSDMISFECPSPSSQGFSCLSCDMTPNSKNSAKTDKNEIKSQEYINGFGDTMKSVNELNTSDSILENENELFKNSIQKKAISNTSKLESYFNSKESNSYKNLDCKIPIKNMKSKRLFMREYEDIFVNYQTNNEKSSNLIKSEVIKKSQMTDVDRQDSFFSKKKDKPYEIFKKLSGIKYKKSRIYVTTRGPQRKRRINRYTVFKPVSKALKKIESKITERENLKSFKGTPSDIIYAFFNIIERLQKIMSARTDGRCNIQSMDEILPAFIFCLLESNISHPVSFYHWLHGCLKPSQRTSNIGYMLNLLEQSIQYINDLYGPYIAEVKRLPKLV